MDVVYRYSSQAKKLVHIRKGEKPFSYISLEGKVTKMVPLLWCGMWSTSMRGNWQETSDKSLLPAHLTLCQRCVAEMSAATAPRPCIPDERREGDQDQADHE